jgi:hypothetical protein
MRFLFFKTPGSPQAQGSATSGPQFIGSAYIFVKLQKVGNPT